MLNYVNFFNTKNVLQKMEKMILNTDFCKKFKIFLKEMLILC